MDFGDILDAWDKQTAHAGKKRGTASTGGEENAVVDPVTAWLRVNGVYDKDGEGLEADERRAAERRRRLRMKKPDATLDLHGLSRDDAWEAMETFFEECRGQEMEKVLLIHGKGNHSEGEAILKRAVIQFIEKCPYAGESGQPGSELGGGGATWVLLKATVPDK
ncbi:MAG: Smr/MutS family protein [Treponema sp.]|nr:Smr/MutS family protein [Treponema sp.]